MPRLAVIGDVHGFDATGARAGVLDRLGPSLHLIRTYGPFDASIQVGDVALDPDLGDDGTWSRGTFDRSVASVLETIGRTLSAPVIFVPGNHDLPDPPAVAGATNVDGRAVEVAGLRVAGIGGAGPALFGFPYEWTDEERLPWVADLASRAGRVAILVAHAPPHGRLDATARGEPVGSAAVQQAILSMKPALVLCGHIHEAAGVVRLAEGATVLNAGALGEPYGRVIAWVVDVGPDGVPARILRVVPHQAFEVPLR